MLPIDVTTFVILSGILGSSLIRYSEPIAQWLERQPNACAQLMKRSFQKPLPVEIPITHELILTEGRTSASARAELIADSSELGEWVELMLVARAEHGRKGVAQFLKRYPIQIKGSKTETLEAYLGDDLVQYLSDHPEGLHFLKALTRFESIGGLNVAGSFDLLKGWTQSQIKLSGREFNERAGQPLSALFTDPITDPVTGPITDPTISRSENQAFTAKKTTPVGNRITLTVNAEPGTPMVIALKLQRLSGESNQAFNERARTVRQHLQKKCELLWKDPTTPVPQLAQFQYLPESGMDHLDFLPMIIQTHDLAAASAYLDYLLKLP
ncbi:MAG: hypothetical protein EOP09_10355 [Proteobacteria bacterium]|nr:MAG: hypothetical protein EOP09_10355 [Pseudomonadota bacterium]